MTKDEIMKILSPYSSIGVSLSEPALFKILRRTAVVLFSIAIALLFVASFMNFPKKATYIGAFLIVFVYLGWQYSLMLLSAPLFLGGFFFFGLNELERQSVFNVLKQKQP